jgi:hypothetical protein
VTAGLSYFPIEHVQGILKKNEWIAVNFAWSQPVPERARSRGSHPAWDSGPVCDRGPGKGEKTPFVSFRRVPSPLIFHSEKVTVSSSLELGG